MRNIEPEQRKIIKELMQKQNESSNVFLAKITMSFSTVVFVFWLLTVLGCISSEISIADYSLIMISFIGFIIYAVCRYKKGRGAAFQYLLILMLMIFLFVLDIRSGYRSRLLICLPLLLSLRYYNRKLIDYTAVSTLMVLFASVIFSSFFYDTFGFIDLNAVQFLKGSISVPQSGMTLQGWVISLSLDPWELFATGMLVGFLPNAVFTGVIWYICCHFMEKNLDNIIRIQELIRLDTERKYELFDMKTKIMLSQIQPHFVYNTLTTIAFLCRKEPENAENLTKRFSKYLRSNMMFTETKDSIPFIQELEHIKNYLEIEHFRFKKRLNVQYYIDVTDFDIPTLTVQPLVENAVKHGICKRVDGGTIAVSAYASKADYCIEVKDDGVGFDIETVKNDGKLHIGLENVTKRIERFGGRIQVVSEPGKGTAVTVFLPKDNNC